MQYLAETVIKVDYIFKGDTNFVHTFLFLGDH